MASGPAAAGLRAWTGLLATPGISGGSAATPDHDQPGRRPARDGPRRPDPGPLYRERPSVRTNPLGAASFGRDGCRPAGTDARPSLEETETRDENHNFDESGNRPLTGP